MHKIISNTSNLIHTKTNHTSSSSSVEKTPIDATPAPNIESHEKEIKSQTRQADTRPAVDINHTSSPSSVEKTPIDAALDIEILSLKKGTILGYKVITNDGQNQAENIDIGFGRTEKHMMEQTKDSSANYINKDIYTALNYSVSKLMDYFYEKESIHHCDSIQLIQIIVNNPFDLIKSEKYIVQCRKKEDIKKLDTRLKNSLGLSQESLLLHEIGNSKNAALLTYDAEGTEIAYPHTLNLDHIDIKTIGKFKVLNKRTENAIMSLTFLDLFSEAPSDENHINQTKAPMTIKPESTQTINQKITESNLNKIISKKYPTVSFM